MARPCPNQRPCGPRRIVWHEIPLLSAVIGGLAIVSMFMSIGGRLLPLTASPKTSGVLVMSDMESDDAAESLAPSSDGPFEHEVDPINWYRRAAFEYEISPHILAAL